MAVSVDFEVVYSIKTNYTNTKHKKVLKGKHEKDIRKRLERQFSVSEPDAELIIHEVNRKKESK